MLPLYLHRDSAIHRLGPGWKLAALFAAGLVVALIPSPWALALALSGVIALYAAARLPAAEMAKALRPVLYFAAVIFALQWAFAGFGDAVKSLLRILILALMATLVTLTTPLSAMIDALSAAARPLAVFGVSPPRLALAVALVIRFIPVLLNDYREIAAARAARGAKYPGLGASGPLLVKTLHMTSALGDAIAARGFDNRR